jgi:hypothetical protein
MGFIEEAGAAQHFRDARITTIYEGTTGIQANDFIGRKTARDGGAMARVVADAMDGTARELASRGEPELRAIGARLAEGVAAVRAAAAWLVPAYGSDPRAAHAVAVPYLRLWGLVTGAWQLGRGALAAQRHLSAGTGDARFLAAKVHTARFHAEALLPQAAGLAQSVAASGGATMELASEQF